MKERDRVFYEDLASSIDQLTADAAAAVRQPSGAEWEETEAFQVLSRALASAEQHEAFERVVGELLRVLTHSILVTIDGGTEYAERYGTPQLVHGDGEPFGAALHEFFIEHLFDTGRLR
jgi:hypothetical protein